MINFKHEFLVMAIFLSITMAGIVQNKDIVTKNEIPDKNYTLYNGTGMAVINNTNVRDMNIEKVNKTIDKEKEARKRIEKLYNKTKSDNIVAYTFNTGEIIELNTSSIIDLSEITNDTNTNISIEPGGLRYITMTDKNNTDIIFLGEINEKILPNINNLLFPIILEIKNKTLKEGEIFNLKSNYSISINESYNDNQSLKVRIIKNNVTIRDIVHDNKTILGDNKTIEWWEYLNKNPGDYRKRKVISIKIIKIDDTEIVADIIQYDYKKTITLGNIYREFQIVNITENIIEMKNVEYVRLDRNRKFSIGRLLLYVD